MLLYNAENLQLWHLVTAVSHFILHLVAFIVTCFLSTLLEVVEDASFSTEQIFNSEFEKYFILAAGIYLVFPFAISTLLIFSLLTRNKWYMKVYIISFLVTTGIFEAAVLGSGIYIVVKGTAYIGYILIGVFIIYALIISHAVLLGKYTYNSYDDESSEGTTENQSQEEAESVSEVS